MTKPAVLALLVAGCATPPQAAQPLEGSWGGRHVGLSAGQSGGTLEYDCAKGTIVGPIVPNRAGNFEARGTHTPGQGGPDHIGYAPPSYPARYSGTVRGGTMTLAVNVAALDAHIGPYMLRRGADPTLLRCL